MCPLYHPHSSLLSSSFSIAGTYLLRYHVTILTALQSQLCTSLAIPLLYILPKALPHAVATMATPTASQTAYVRMMGSFRVDLVQTRLGNRLAALRIVLQVDLLCLCSFPATDYFPEHLNASINIFNCKGQGTYQCGWGDCSINSTDQNPFNIIFGDDQKSAATSLPSKRSDTLAVGLGVSLSLGFCLLITLYLLHRQRRPINSVESQSSRSSIEKPWGGWQWAHGHCSL